MLVDDKPSKQSEYLISHAEPTHNLNNNIFIRLAASSQDNYEASKQRYITVSKKAKLAPLKLENVFSFPSLLITEEELNSDLYCSFNDDGCFESISENREFLFEGLNKRMIDAKEIVLNQSQFNFQPIDPVSTEGDHGAFKSFNYLIGLQIYKYLLDGETYRAEELLLKYFIFSRKVAEGSLDSLTSVVFIVSVKDYFQPLIEKILGTGHIFNSTAVNAFHEFSMSQISLKKLVNSNFSETQRYIDNYVSNVTGTNIFDKFFVCIGFRRIATLNKIAEYWIRSTVPETTKKQNFFAVKRAIVANQPVFPVEHSILSLLKNPRNFIGDIVLTTLHPYYLDSSEDFASADLTLLLFKLAIEGQHTPIAGLISDPRFIDPYTGNYPYLEESKVCYPAWIALDNRKSDSQCIQLPNLNR